MPDPSANGADVGPDGGRVTSNGVTLEIPAGALSEHVSIVVTTSPTRPPGYAIDGEVLHFEPKGLHFATPITVSFPAGAEGHGVYWTVDGDESTFEPLETTLDGTRVVAHPTHFSGGFVGAGGGITCIAQRRANCALVTTIENDVKIWFDGFGSDREKAIATSSPALNAFYASTGAHWFATDDTRTRYEGGSEAVDFITRTGAVGAMSVDAGRGGTPLPACPTVPIIHVTCSGSTTIGNGAPPPPPPPVDAGTDAAPPPVDAGTDAAPPPVDAGTDAAPPPPTGVTCTVKRRGIVTDPVTNQQTCVYDTTTETNVKFWLERRPGQVGLEGAMNSSSPGIQAYYNSVNGPFWYADGTHSQYSDGNGVTIPRTDNTVTVSFHRGRGGTPLPQCPGFLLIDVACSGTTGLGK